MFRDVERSRVVRLRIANTFQVKSKRRAADNQFWPDLDQYPSLPRNSGGLWSARGAVLQQKQRRRRHEIPSDAFSGRSPAPPCRLPDRGYPPTEGSGVATYLMQALGRADGAQETPTSGVLSAQTHGQSEVSEHALFQNIARSTTFGAQVVAKWCLLAQICTMYVPPAWRAETHLAVALGPKRTMFLDIPKIAVMRIATTSGVWVDMADTHLSPLACNTGTVGPRTGKPENTVAWTMNQPL